MQVESIEYEKNGRYKITFDDGRDILLYKGEKKSCQLTEGMEVSEELFSEIYHGILGKRIKKRAMFLLEKMDRTEAGLKRKLLDNGYPEDLVDEAIDYVKGFHYLDDLRYARNYVQIYGANRSRMRIRTDLIKKGVSRENIEQALEEEYSFSEGKMIQDLLRKKHFDPETATAEEQRKIYGFLLRRGFKNNEILSAMKCTEYLT